MELRICKKCNIEKEISIFRANRHTCILCERIQNNEREHKRYENKKEIILEKQRIKNNTQEQKEKRLNYNKKNKLNISNTRKKYYQDNKESELKYAENYRLFNKDTLRSTQNKSINKRRKDPIIKLRHNVSVSIRNLINKNNISILKYLPYTIDELKNHIENQFESWMSWENLGVYKKPSWDDNKVSTWVWQIDHIIPQSDLPYNSMEHENFKKCWALENLRPLSAKQNLLDGVNKIRHKEKI